MIELAVFGADHNDVDAIPAMDGHLVKGKFAAVVKSLAAAGAACALGVEVH